MTRCRGGADLIAGVPQRSRDAVADLLLWMQQQGALWRGFSLVAEGEERGLRSTTLLPPNQEIMFIPKHLHFQSRCENERLPHPGKLGLFSKHSALALYLLEAAAADSHFHRPYLATLPAHYRHIPLCAEADALVRQCGGFTRFLIDQRVTSLHHDYGRLCHERPGFDRFDYDDFRTMIAAVNSRCFTRPDLPEQNNAVMVPLLDMFNHANPPNCTWSYSRERGGFVVTTKTKVAADTELTLCYGKKPSARFFVSYGFVEAEASVQAVPIQVVVPDDDPFYAQKKRFIEQLGGPWFALVDDDNKLLRRCLTALRCCITDWSDVRQRSRVLARLPLTAAIERRVLEALRGARLWAPSPFSPLNDSLATFHHQCLVTIHQRQQRAKNKLDLFVAAALEDLDSGGPPASAAPVRRKPPAWRRRLLYWREQEAAALQSERTPLGVVTTVRIQAATQYAWPALCRIRVHEQQQGFVPAPETLAAQADNDIGTQVITVQAGRDIVGLFTLTRVDNNTVRLAALQIDQHHQGRGYGRQVMCLLKEHFLAQGFCGTLTLAVHKDNQVAGAFFRAEGFQVIAQQANCEERRYQLFFGD